MKKREKYQIQRRRKMKECCEKWKRENIRVQWLDYPHRGLVGLEDWKPPFCPECSSPLTDYCTCLKYEPHPLVNKCYSCKKPRKPISTTEKIYDICGKTEVPFDPVTLKRRANMKILKIITFSIMALCFGYLCNETLNLGVALFMGIMLLAFLIINIKSFM